MLIVVTQVSTPPVHEENAALPPHQSGEDLGQPLVTNITRWPCRVFRGRTPLLNELRRHLQVEPVLALTGPSGIGKSQVALAYAATPAYQLVWWLRGDSPEVFEAGLAALGQRLAAADTRTRSHAEEVESARAWLLDHDNWLVVIDDAPDASLVLPTVPRGAGHVLITSRIPFPEPGRQNFPIPVLDPQAATEFLLHRTGATDTAGAGRVAAALGFFPLALELAGGYVEQFGTFADYLKLLAGRGPDPGEPGRAVTAAIRISLERIRAVSPAAVELLWLCAFLAPDEIPMDALAPSLGSQGAALRKAAAANRLDQAIGVAWRLALLERQSFGVWMHEQVQRVVRDEVPPAERSAWASAAVATLRTAFPPDPDDPGFRFESERLLPHGFAAADHARGLGVDPAAVASLYHHVGRYHRSRSDLARARVSIELSLALTEGSHGPRHPGLAAPLNDLGWVLRDLAEPAAARACFERALAINEATYGPSHPDVAVTLDNLAQLLYAQGDLPGARAGFDRALAIDVATYGPDHVVVGHLVKSMAGVLGDQQDLAGARAWYERALAIDEMAYGPGHPVVADDLVKLAGVLRDSGELAWARVALERALAINESVYGPADPAVAEVVKRLAGILRDLGDLVGARAGFQRALTIEEMCYGPDHPSVAGIVNNLAVVLRDGGDLHGARAGFERALAIEEAAYGPDHAELVLVVDNLALALQDLGDLAGARAGFDRAFVIDEANFGRDHAAASPVASHRAALLASLPVDVEPEPEPEPELEFVESAPDAVEVLAEPVDSEAGVVETGLLEPEGVVEAVPVPAATPAAETGESSLPAEAQGGGFAHLVEVEVELPVADVGEAGNDAATVGDDASLPASAAMDPGLDTEAAVRREGNEPGLVPEVVAGTQPEAEAGARAEPAAVEPAEPELVVVEREAEPEA
ncbi:MAG: FxSxx-COOH system tetratricopeptide repeat protein, partial [Actinomycetota bacterium]|nr:FxSxx-COOH system tetratricopeptide repeat protein [Actinomycetota bacterium]